MGKAGAKYREVYDLPKIAVIEADPRLRDMFDNIVRKFVARYIQHDNTQLGLFERS